jgi:hypothetical protein
MAVLAFVSLTLSLTVDPSHPRNLLEILRLEVEPMAGIGQVL